MVILKGGNEMNTKSSPAKLFLAIAIICSSIQLGVADDASHETSAKNVIILIGDGMGFPQLTLARIDRAG